MPGGTCRPPRGVRCDVGRALAKRSVSIETTAGRAWSATASNAVSVSAAEAICAGAGFVALTRPCAQLKCVRSKPEAKTRPQKNATTIAAPKRAREYRLDIADPSLKKVIDLCATHCRSASFGSVWTCKRLQ